MESKQIKFTATKDCPRWRDRYGADKEGNWKDGEINTLPADVADHMARTYPKNFSLLKNEDDKMQRGAPETKSFKPGSSKKKSRGR